MCCRSLSPRERADEQPYRSRGEGIAALNTRGKIIAVVILIAGLAFSTHSEENAAPDLNAVPWGIASSSSSFKTHAEWFPKLSEAGVPWVRMFPEWRSVEPAQGAWKWDKLDAMLKSAADNNIQILAILMGSAAWTKDKSHAFPMKNLEDWSNYVTASVERYKNQVHYWEVWNEGNGGFNDNHNSTADYASLVAATYTAVKKADPSAQVGMTVASFDAPYLNQAILAMAKAGKPNNFDFLCIHPYEVADGLAEPNGEIPYLWMTHTLRDILKANAPERANADIWITEVSRRVENKSGKSITEDDAAKTLVKLYTMASAQGIKHTLWFEARDPVGEDQGFGLLKRDGTPRAAYNTIKTMTTCLGPTPKYLGWLALGENKRGYGFVFQGATAPVMAAWMPAGETFKLLAFSRDVQVIDSLSGIASALKTGDALSLTDTPVFVTSPPKDLIELAKSNAAKNFPWGGDYSAASALSVQLGAVEPTGGIYQLSHKSTPAYSFPDGSTGIQIQGNQYATFYVHPSFANFQTNDYYVRITVRRMGPGNAGMNLNYEVADSKGHAAYKNKGEWYSLSEDPGWQTHTWHIPDACFSKMWGYDFNFHPEKASPFVIGKVEVSKVPF